MDHPEFSQQPGVHPHAATQVRLRPLNFAPEPHPSRFREAGDSRDHGLSPLGLPGLTGLAEVDGISSAPVFHTQGPTSFPSPFAGPPPSHGLLRGLDHVQNVSTNPQHGHLRPPSRDQPPPQTHERRDRLPLTPSTDVALPRLSQFGLLSQSQTGSRVATDVNDGPRTECTDLVRTASAKGRAALEPTCSGQLHTDIVEEPPDLAQWRQRLFALEAPVILTAEEYATYFPWVDNVYSHRSTQTYQRKSCLTHYYDCRMKGRPSGTPKSDDPNKKKRKRTARPRDLCDVKIKITEYPTGSVAELREGDGVDLDGRVLQEALARIRDGPLRVVRRINGSGTNGGPDGNPATHKHDLQKSDEIKKSKAVRRLAELEREAKRSQKPSPWRPRGDAAITAKNHTKDADLKFYSACFCPFSQRVWIALEAKGLEYQYCEIYPLRKPKPTPLLEANPRGLVPAILQEDWACAESSVILEYLEDFNRTVPLYPSVPRLKANCRLWVDFINTRVVPAFYNVLASTEEEARGHGMERLHRHISDLVQAAGEKGPYFLGDHMCLVDIHLAPFALRLSRLTPFRDFPPPTPHARWKAWLAALEQNPHVRSTTSAHGLYTQTTEDLIKGFQGTGDGV